MHRYAEEKSPRISKTTYTKAVPTTNNKRIKHRKSTNINTSNIYSLAVQYTIAASAAAYLFCVCMCGGEPLSSHRLNAKTSLGSPCGLDELSMFDVRRLDVACDTFDGCSLGFRWMDERQMFDRFSSDGRSIDFR